MNDNVLLHLEDAVNQVRALFLKAATRIEELKPGEKVPATQLAADLAAERGMTGPALYPVLKFLFEGYPGILVKRGAHGGLIRPAVQSESNKSSDKPESESESESAKTSGQIL